MHLSQAIKRWMAVIVFIVLALIFHRFRWGILGFVNIGPLPTACDNRGALDAYLRTGGDPEAYLGRTPLIMCATKKGSYEIVARLIDLGVDIDAQKKRPLLPFIDSSTGTTALHVAVMEGNFESAKVLFENGADVNWEGLSSISPLNLTVALNRPEFLRLFLEADRTVYEFDESRIRSAANDGHIEIFRVLFKADIHFERTYEIAVVRAASEGHLQLVKFLYGQDISINKKVRPTESTALHASVQSNDVNVVEFLVSVGANINARDDKGNTPLHYATMSKHVELVQVLVDSDADISLENDEGQTPLDLAIKHNSLDVVNILKNARVSL